VGSPAKFNPNTELFASDLNRLSREAIRKVSAGPGISVRNVGNQVTISVNGSDAKPIQGMLVATIVAEVSPGIYTWDKYKGHGPDQGRQAGTGRPDLTAHEVNGIEDIAPGKKVTLFRFESVWWFSWGEAGEAAAETGILYEAVSGTYGRDWNMFREGNRHVGGLVDGQIEGAATSGQYGFVVGMSVTNNSVDPGMRINWDTGVLIPTGYKIGAQGFRIRQKFIRVSGVDKCRLRFGVYDPITIALDPLSFQPSTAHGFVEHTTCKVERVDLIGSDAVFNDMELTQAQLSPLYSAGSTLRFYVTGRIDVPWQPDSTAHWLIAKLRLHLEKVI